MKETSIWTLSFDDDNIIQ